MEGFKIEEKFVFETGCGGGGGGEGRGEEVMLIFFQLKGSIFGTVRYFSIPPPPDDCIIVLAVPSSNTFLPVLHQVGEKRYKTTLFYWKQHDGRDVLRLNSECSVTLRRI